jgi:CRP-like cAMP-binding protein
MYPKELESKPEDPEKTRATENSPFVNLEGLTQRRRNYVLSCTPPSKKYSEIFRRALIRFRGFRLWHKMLEEIRTYGTGSVLFDANNTYKANLKEIMHEKVLMIEKYQDVQVKSKENYLFHPDSKIHTFWSFVVFVFVLYTFTLMPWIMAFEEVQVGNRWFFIETLADCVFLVDILITLNSSYYDKDKVIVRSRFKVFLNYLFGWLLVDIITILPFSFMLESGTSDPSNRSIKFIRLLRIIRVVRAKKIGKIFKILAETNTFSFLKTHQGITRLLGGLFAVLLMTHFFACIWFLSSKIDNFEPDTWVVRKNLQDEDHSTLYLTSLYFICTVLTTVGFGDIFPVTVIEKLIAMTWMVYGIGFYSFVVGNLSSVLSSLDQKQAFINEKLSLIQIFAEETKLPQKISIEISNQVKQALRATSLNDEERVSLVQKLSKGLRFEMATLMYENAIKNITFFVSKDQSFVSDIVPMLNLLKIAKRNLIYEKHQYADEMYFIKTGRVCFIYGKTKRIFKVMIQGSYFGEIELIENTPREFSVAAQKDSEFLTMSKNLFEYMMEKYPAIAIDIKNLAIERKKRIIKCKKELVDVLGKVEVRKERTFNQLAGEPKLKKNTAQQRALNEQTYLDEEVQYTVRWIHDKIEEYEKILTSSSLRKHLGDSLRKSRKSLPPLPQIKK